MKYQTGNDYLLSVNKTENISNATTPSNLFELMEEFLKQRKSKKPSKSKSPKKVPKKKKKKLKKRKSRDYQAGYSSVMSSEEYYSYEYDDDDDDDKDDDYSPEIQDFSSEHSDEYYDDTDLSKPVRDEIEEDIDVSTCEHINGNDPDFFEAEGEVRGECLTEVHGQFRSITGRCNNLQPEKRFNAVEFLNFIFDFFLKDIGEEQSLSTEEFFQQIIMTTEEKYQ